MPKPVLSLPVLTALLLCAALPGGAQKYRDWQVTKGDAGCVASIDVGLKGPGSGLMSFAVFARRGARRDAPGVISLRVPLGVHLASGIAYSHPRRSDAVGLAWQYCDDRTCLATGALSTAELRRLKAGQRVFVAFRPLPGSRALIVPVSLLGFTRAWSAVQACA